MIHQVALSSVHLHGDTILDSEHRLDMYTYFHSVRKRRLNTGNICVKLVEYETAPKYLYI